MADARGKVTLAIAGQLYDGWTGVEIDQSLEQLASSFRLRLTTRWPNQPRRMEIKAGEACKLAIGGENLMTGWIDTFEPRFDDRQFSVEVTGRDRAADLIDCAAVHKTGSWRNVKLEAIAAELAQPFGIKVTAEADTGPAPRRFALQQGETVFDAIERLARVRALLVVSTPDGDIKLISPAKGRAGVTLEQGLNLLSAEARHSAAERFSKIIVKGQTSGDDDANGKAVSAIRAEASDPAIKRHRPLIIIAEDQSDQATAAKRAKWEVTVRAARAQSADVTVQGWRDGSGALWKRNRLVSLKAPLLQIEAEMLVAGVRFSLGDGGTLTGLTLAIPEAYSQQPISAKAAASALGGDQ